MKSVCAKRKLNNKGVSLIELIVAITILSIVAVGFYSCFILVAKTNAKAKEQHKATTLAQNLLENLKSESMDDIMKQVVWPVYTTVDEAGNVQVNQNFRLLPSGIIESGYDFVNNVGNFAPSGTSYATTVDGGATATYNQDLDTYQFYLRNLKMENTSFDALVTIDGAGYMGSSAVDYNSADVVRIPTMDANYDAVVSNCGVYDAEAISHFQSAGIYDVAKITRTVTVDITETLLLSGNIEQLATATYLYECNGEEYKQVDTVFYNADDYSVHLRNVFVFVNPHYDWDISGHAERIVLNYPKDMEPDLYVIKLQPTSDVSLLAAYDTQPYEMKVDVNAREKGGALALVDCNVDIRTNLGYQYVNPREKITGGDDQALYSYNGTNVVTAAELENCFHLASLTNKGATDKLFDVKVEIYKSTPGEPITGIENYTVDKAEDLRATLEGTIRN